CQHYYSTPYSC
nr:immunoglobulin light chain junction region [Macaca mulatta]MPN99054.1 immunoglobulin light chain junction region [Macaca mulatta]MPO02033.1 immunoglobulin light chain junction region [Macaca mulatta]MPO02761.1 immunoglobulin light chain junction region [Macaca mulatta]